MDGIPAAYFMQSVLAVDALLDDDYEKAHTVLEGVDVDDSYFIACASTVLLRSAIKMVAEIKDLDPKRLTQSLLKAVVELEVDQNAGRA